jgi:WD40 repeat protein
MGFIELPLDKLLALGRKGNIDIYDMKNNFKHFYSVPKLNKENPRTKIIFLSNGYFATTTDNGPIEILDINLEKKETLLIQQLEGHKSSSYDILELSNGKLVSVSNNGQIIFWEYEPSTNLFKLFKEMNEHPNEYSQLLEDKKRNLLICSPCFDSQGTAIIDLQTFSVLKKFEEIAGNGSNEILMISDNILLDNSAADEVGLFFIDLEKKEIIKHDEKFNDHKTTVFLKLKNGYLLAGVYVGDRQDFDFDSDDEDDDEKYNEEEDQKEEKINEKFHCDIQTIKILDNGEKLLTVNTKSCVDYAPILSMIELKDGRIVTGSNRIKVYE